MTICNLPTEVIHQILLCVPPTCLATLELVSKRFKDLVSQPVLWHDHCRRQFSYWNDARNMDDRSAGNIADTDWKALYIDRHRTDGLVSRGMDSILATQTSRSFKTTNIIDVGYEAKETLIRHSRANGDMEDFLARRFYSDAVLRSLNRSLGIQQWIDLRHGRYVPLERALAAFDMFTSQGDEMDFNKVAACLDTIARGTRDYCPDLADRPVRQQAIIVAEYLRRSKFTGVRSTADYHDLPNNFIGLALRDEEHQSLPLVLVAIYCCVARRLGLDAQPCGFPLHVHAIIKAPKDQDLDGRTTSIDTDSSSMYMDPWHSSDETPKEELIARLRALNAEPSEFGALLAPSSTAEIVRRTARNIMTSVKMLSQTTGNGRHLNLSSAYPDANGAFYGSLWALILLPEDNSNRSRIQRGKYVPYLLHHVEQDFPLDLGLFERIAAPLFREENFYEQLLGRVRSMRTEDDSPKPRKDRTSKARDNVRYKVGQVFRHKRYNYNAVITGWDAECEAGEDWIRQMNVRSLPRGQHQAFYHVMVEDRSTRYVAEENVQIATPNGPTPSLMAIAGQHFKRWDTKSKVFVSNIRDEYPDD